MDDLPGVEAGCRRFREELVALRLGEEPEVPADELRRHLEGCADCRLAAESAAGLEKLLASVQPPPAPAGLRRLRVAVAALESDVRARPQPSSRQFHVALAVAAGLVLAMTILRLALPDGSKPTVATPEHVAVMVGRENAAGLDVTGSGWAPGQRLLSGTRFKVPPGERVRLAFDRGAQIEVVGAGFVEVVAADRVRLTNCKLLAAVEKGRAPFCVETDSARVVTLGTRFTVEDSPQETRVTVLDGRVRFESAGRPESFVEVAAGQTSVATAAAAPSVPAAPTPDTLAWLLAAPRPQLELKLSVSKAEVRAGERVAARLELVNRSAAGVRIDGCGRSVPAYFLRVTDPAGREFYLCPAVLGSSVDGEPSSAALVELKPGSGYGLELDVGGLAGPPGEYRLTGIYFGTLRAENAGWSGTLESLPAAIRRK